MNKEQLETNLAALKLLVSEHNEKTADYKDQVASLEKQLEDYNKPELTPMQMDDVYEAIEKAVNSYDFSDTDNFEIDYGLDYDGRVMCESHEFINESDLVQMIADKVCMLFKEADCPEDDNSQVNTHTVAEKIV
tara:strand:+ start:57 stop:458 length:402 start_codon:yes stop_codon:yes gene_type:complete